MTTKRKTVRVRIAVAPVKLPIRWTKKAVEAAVKHHMRETLNLPEAMINDPDMIAPEDIARFTALLNAATRVQFPPLLSGRAETMTTDSKP